VVEIIKLKELKNQKKYKQIKKDLTSIINTLETCEKNLIKFQDYAIIKKMMVEMRELRLNLIKEKCLIKHYQDVKK
jgi:hypothetical protein